MYVIDLEGNEYPLQATTTNEKEVNGNQSLSATILSTKVNKKFISDIKEMWRIVDHDNVEHKIIYAKRKGVGRYEPEYKEVETIDSIFYYRPTQSVVRSSTSKEKVSSSQLQVEIKAIPLFFDDFDNDRIYDNINEHMTAISAFTKLFHGTNYDFVLVDRFDAVQWEGFGAGETRLETFKRCLDRYKCEFRISGNIIYLEKQVGRDTQFQYRHRLNSSNIEEEIDAGEMWTYAKGYGDYGNEGDAGEEGKEDWENAKLIEEYTSPLADIIGVRHAPPIKDGRITRKAKMQDSLKELVDESLKVSVSADVYDLQKQGYPVAQSEVGDRVFLIDERIGLDDEVRVISQSKTRNWKGDVIDLNITFGSEGIEKRHRSQLSTAVKDIQDLITGRKKLPYSVLPAAEQSALRALREAQTELIFGSNENGIQGIIAQEKDDPNRLVWLNSAGWMISTDGGATSNVAATADGIVADVIYTGTLNADKVNVYGGDGKSYAYLSGSEIETRGTHTRTWFGESETHDVGLQLRYGRLRFHNYENERNLYISEKGIGTYIGGSDAEDGGYQGSGVIEFFSHMYDSEVRGLTLYSNRGTIGLRADTRDVILDADRNSDIRSRRGSVLIKPHIDTRPGYNHFRLAVKDNSSASDTDGYMTFGNTNNGHASGIRFKKSKSGEPLIWATDGSGAPATGSFYGRRLYGDLMPRGSYAYAIAPRLRVVTNENKDTYGDVQADRYLTSSGASAFVGARSAMLSSPKPNEATKLLNELDLVRFTDDKNNPEFKISSNQSVSVDDGDTTDNDKALYLAIKSLQEIVNRVEELEASK